MISMEIQTSQFGELSVSENEIYTFPKGLPGFEDQTSFVIVAPEEDDPFAFLQSATTSELVFVIADPFLFYPNYDFELSDMTVAELKILSPEQVLVRSIISVPDDLDKATVNLVAPLVFNLDDRIAKQIVLGKTPYTTKHSLFTTAER